MLALGEEGLKEHIKTIGLFNSKAKNVIALSQMLVDDYGGEVPGTARIWSGCPASGARPPMSCSTAAFGQETFAVDTHIFRVGNRTGLAKGKTPEQVEAKLEKRVPEPFRLHAHHWLILHGRYVCKARDARVLALQGGGLVRLPEQGARTAPSAKASGRRLRLRSDTTSARRRLTMQDRITGIVLAATVALALSACSQADRTLIRKATPGRPPAEVVGKPVDCIQSSRID